MRVIDAIKLQMSRRRTRALSRTISISRERPWLSKTLICLDVVCLSTVITAAAQQGNSPTVLDGREASILAHKEDGKVATFSPKQMKAISIRRVSPKYPNNCSCQGTVVVSVVVNVEGNVECVRAIDGHPLLTQAALDSAKQ